MPLPSKKEILNSLSPIEKKRVSALLLEKN